MILLRDFALFVLPALVAAGGWLHALSLRGQARPDQERGSRRVPAGRLAR
ncbi:hypothetical protein [Bradyrhizobium liaoningense]|nr:hypothetical protein [Bradyrhizobium liaoningense]MBR0854277.1 hypothetical protein [Bradyrhizobium liaoningense]